MVDPQISVGSNKKKEEEFSRWAVKFINSRKIKFVIICGDHTHDLEGFWNKVNKKEEEKKKGQRKRFDQLDAYKTIYSKLDKDIPLVCDCGNHDVGNQLTKETIALFLDEFGVDFLFWVGGVKFICFNYQLTQGSDNSPDLSKDHEYWFDLELKRDCRPVHLVVCAHISSFCFYVEESTGLKKHAGNRWIKRMMPTC